MLRPRSLLSLAFASLVAAGSEGCAPNQISFFIVQNQQPIPAGNACTVGVDPTSARRNEGVLDVALRNNYILTPLFQSQLQAYADPSRGRAETRGLFVEGAVVSLRRGSPDGPEVVAPYTVYFSTFVPPSTGGAPSYATGEFELIRTRDVLDTFYPQVCGLVPPAGRPECPVPTYQSAPQRIIAVVRPFGTTMGGISIEGAVFNYPITLCCHCLISFPPDADLGDDVQPGPDCLNGAGSQASCNFGQDIVSDCRFCTGPAALCQPAGYTPRGVPMLCPAQ